MRILYYSPHPNLNLSDPAGYGTHMREMIKAFRDLGHEVLPLIMGGTEPKGDHKPPQNSRLKQIAKKLIPASRWQTMKDNRLLDFDEEAFVKLRDTIKEFQPHFIYERANYLQASGVRAATKAKVTHYMEMNSPYVDEKVELEGAISKKMLEEATNREYEQLMKSSQVLVVSSALRDYFMDKYGIFRNKFTVIPNAIDPQKGDVDPARVEAIQKKYNLQGKTVYGWVGSIQPWHGMEKLIQTFAQLHAKHPETALMIVGSGETIDQVKAAAAKTKAAANIHFTGYLPHADVFPHIAATDICLLPSTNWYCSPIKIFEYGLLGKAVIATDHPAILDVMVPGQDGAVIPKDDDTALLQAMENLHLNPEVRKQMALNFHEKVMRLHTWEANAKRVLGLFQSANASIPRS